jgi:hypothetical protein
MLVFLDRHKKFAWLLAVLPTVIWGTIWSLDRAPPFRIVTVDPIQPIRAGDELIMNMRVDRDLERKCSATITRFFMDSQHTKRGMMFETLNYDGIVRRAEKGSELKLALPTPRNMPSGPTELYTESVYSCATNPLTYLAPIRLSWVFNFEVLPPLNPEAVVVITKPDAVDRALKLIKPASEAQ